MRAPLRGQEYFLAKGIILSSVCQVLTFCLEGYFGGICREPLPSRQEGSTWEISECGKGEVTSGRLLNNGKLDKVTLEERFGIFEE